VRPVHSSFFDFLKDRKRCESPLLFIGPEHEENLARRCMQLMCDSLKRNVCNLADPLVRNNDIIAAQIPKELVYACRFWSHHLQSLPSDQEAYCLVEDFLFTKVLFWLEVMSLIGRIDDSIPSLKTAHAWVQVRRLSLNE
jgi:hypothetical protein